MVVWTSIFPGLFSYFVILSPIGECVLSHFIAGKCLRLQKGLSLGPTDQQVYFQT